MSSGRVSLVGAGPGDPGLMTVRALELIARADVIVHDRLIPAGALDGARAGAELVYVGKEGGGPSTPQEQITSLLVDHARAGARVVRLKGGDPFVFGRGGEEALALRAADVAFDVVPGVTAGVAAPAYAGIPVTHRDRASAVAFVTGHEDPTKPGSALDWPALARFPGTLVFYMGVRALAELTASLQEAGRPAAEPAAVVERGTQSDQRVVIDRLDRLAERAAEAGLRAPAVTVVGAVADLGLQLSWWQRGPLAGRTVAITRARAQASELAARLRELGARTVETPTIRIQPLAGPPPELSAYDLVCLTSPNGVVSLYDRIQLAGGDARAFAETTIAAIGPGTAAALAERGLRADIVAERFVAEGLVEALGQHPVRRALVARAAVARDVLPDALRARGAEVDVLPLYETRAGDPAPDAVGRAQAADYLTFTSSSTVRFWLQAVGAPWTPSPSTRIVSIGPVTSATLREAGVEPALEATRHDIEGLVATLVADATALRDGSGAG